MTLMGSGGVLLGGRVLLLFLRAEHMDLRQWESHIEILFWK
jgi:hypothetical protein